MTGLCLPAKMSPQPSADDSEHLRKAVMACESMGYACATWVLGWGHAWVQPCVPIPIMLWVGATSLLYLPSCVLQMFKGPDKDIEFIYTAPSSAVCGVSLDVGGKKEYLIAGVWEFTLPH